MKGDKHSISLCVFCGSSPGHDPGYRTLAHEAGMAIARRGWRLVYGGGHMGMMGALADGALVGGGKITGIIPGFLEEREVAHTGLDELMITQTMHERQKSMADRADGFLILPGGLGTLAEFFEALTWRQLGLHQKPLALLNHNGFWDSLLAMLGEIETRGFLHSQARADVKIAKTIEESLEYISISCGK